MTDSPSTTPVPTAGRTIALTTLAMLAFAANSILCRRALGGEPVIDPASFTAIRLASGAAVLVLLVRWRRRGSPADAARDGGAHRRGRAHHLGPAMLFLYAAGFSYAYLALAAGTGALLLFGSVQVTMFGASLLAGIRPRPLEWAGLLAAMIGLAWLVAPGLEAPDPIAAALMAVAGVAWGVYSLRGRGTRDPAGRTATNFARTLPLAAGLLLLHAVARTPHASVDGVVLATVSGAVTSGLGYVIWYAALPGLTAVRAALVQLSVPVITAVAALPLLGEPLTARLLVGGSLVIGGIATAILGRR